nr:uncharacterized protein LOC123745958 isoform X1 [Procambarus clarkii]
MRVKLDLSEFVEDERKFSVVKVNVEESLTVRDVLDKICSRFNVALGHPDGAGQNKLAVGLFEDEFYVNPDETSTVLQETGVLKLRSLPKKGSSAAEGKKRKKGKKGTFEEEVPHSDGEKKTRRNKRGKVDDEIQLQDSIKEEKKEKRSRLSEELIPIENEDDDNRKVRKRKRGKTLEETSEMEMDVLEVKEQRKHKRSKTCEERVDSEDEVHVRGRGKREKVVELQALGEIVRGKKKGKKDKAIESQVETEQEVQEVIVKEKKKRKKEKLVESVSEEDVRKDTKKKKSRSEEQVVVLEKKMDRKKMHKNSTDDDCEMSRARETDKKKKKWQEDKSSQEKEVSTSTVINLESEETSDDGNSSDLNRKYDKQTRFSTKSSDEDYVADSVTDPHDLANFDNPVTKKKRKRKHNKGRRARKEDSYDAYSVQNTICEETPVFATSSDSKHSLPYPKPRNKKPLLNSNFTQRKHIHFASEDEKEVSSAVKDDIKEIAHEIEIVETTTRTSRRNETRSGFAGQSPNHNIMDGINMSPILNRSGVNFEESSSTKLRKEGSFFRSSLSKKAPDVVEVEGESAISYPGECSSLYNISGRSPLNRGKNSNFEQLATLDKIRKNKTITVCKVDSRRDQTNTKPREPPISTSASPFRSPPPIFTSPKPINDECKQTFHNLMTIKNRTVPLVFSNTRAVQQDSRTGAQRDDEVHYYSPYASNRATFNNSFPNGNRSVGGQDFSSSSPQKMSLGKKENSAISQNYSYQTEESMELGRSSHQSPYKSPISESPPGTSKWVAVSDDSLNQRVGISQPKRKDRQTMHSPIGATLLKLRKQTVGEADAGELQVISNDEADIVSQDEISEATYGKELHAEEIRESREHYNLAALNTSTKKNLLSGQVNGKTLMATPTKIDNEVVDLESDEDEMPASKSVRSRMDTSAKVMERDEAMSDPAAEIVVKNKKTGGVNTKTVESSKDTNVSSAEIILDSKKPAGFNADVVEKDKKTSITTEIVVDNEKRVDSIADVIEKNEKLTSFSNDYIDDDDYDDIIEEDEDLGDFDAEIIEHQEEMGGSDGNIQENSEKKSDTPASAAPAVHKVEIDTTEIKEVITEKLKEDLQKEVKQNPGKVSGQGGAASEAYFEKFPLMKVPPKAGEFIAVKVLSLDESYCPVYSNYLQARVINVNGLTVTLKYVDKIKSTKELEAQENVEEVDLTFEEDEVDLTEDGLSKDAVVEELDWRDICEPRLIFP